MRKLTKIRYRKMLLISIVSFFISSLSFLLIPVADFNGNTIQQISAYLVGILFWIGLISGLFISLLLSRERKKNKYRNNKMPGVMCFFKSKEGKICDIVMIILILVFIIVRIFFNNNGVIWICILSFLILSVYMHAVFNGNNYLYTIKKGVS